MVDTILTQQAQDPRSVLVRDGGENTHPVGVSTSSRMIDQATVLV